MDINTSVPLDNSLLILIVPLCDSIKYFTIDKPKPLPPDCLFLDLSVL